MILKKLQRGSPESKFILTEERFKIENFDIYMKRLRKFIENNKLPYVITELK